jgi:hypothetical protein
VPGLAFAQADPTLRPKIGESIVVELTGKPAATYLGLLNQPVPDGEFGVPLEARIIRINRDTLIADYQIMTKRAPDVAELVTVTVSFHRPDLAFPVSDPSDYRSPHRKAHTEEDRLVQATIAKMASLPKVRKHSFEGVKIRVWSLAREFVE